MASVARPAPEETSTAARGEARRAVRASAARPAPTAARPTPPSAAPIPTPLCASRQAATPAPATSPTRPRSRPAVSSTAATCAASAERSTRRSTIRTTAASATAPWLDGPRPGPQPRTTPSVAVTMYLSMPAPPSNLCSYAGPNGNGTCGGACPDFCAAWIGICHPDPSEASACVNTCMAKALATSGVEPACRFQLLQRALYDTRYCDYVKFGGSLASAAIELRSRARGWTGRGRHAHVEGNPLNAHPGRHGADHGSVRHVGHVRRYRVRNRQGLHREASPQALVRE